MSRTRRGQNERPYIDSPWDSAEDEHAGSLLLALSVAGVPMDVQAVHHIESMYTQLMNMWFFVAWFQVCCWGWFLGRTVAGGCGGGIGRDIDEEEPVPTEVFRLSNVVGPGSGRAPWWCA